VRYPWHKIETISNSFPKTDKKRLKKVDNLLREKYPSGEQWLKTKLSEKKPVKFIITDLQHILTWAWEERLFKHPVYSERIIEYILSGYFNHLNITLTNFALEKKIIDEKLIDIMKTSIKANHGYIKKSAILLCLKSMKEFSELSDEDIFENEYILKKISPKNINCLKQIQGLRIQLGFSGKIVKKKHKNNWDYLIKKHPEMKCIISNYKEYLLTAQFSKSTIKQKSISLKNFLNFIKENSFSLNKFNRESFLILFKKFEKVYTNKGTLGLFISGVFTFFEWGIEIEEDTINFPKKLDFPLDYKKRLNREIKKERYNSEGHSFNNENIANEFVKTMLNFNPVGEKEFLALKYLMVLCSVPCRKNYIRNLPVNCLSYLENTNDLYGITSFNPDKAGNIHGEFPILDKIGLDAIRQLQERVNNKKFTAIENPNNGEKYVHLFQLETHPYILTEKDINHILDRIREKMPVEYRNSNITAHKFRTHILTEITIRTRDIEITKTAAGHRNSSMTKLYLRSNISKNALLNTIKEGYENKEFTGKFYLRLLEAVTEDNITNDEVISALDSEISINEFLAKFGTKRDMGYCLIQGVCSNHYKCWGCKHFFMTKNEVETAIKTLTTHLLNFKALMKYSKDFTFENPIVASKQKAIGLIIKHICNLGYTPEQVLGLVGTHIHESDREELLPNEYS